MTSAARAHFTRSPGAYALQRARLRIRTHHTVKHRIAEMSGPGPGDAAVTPSAAGEGGSSKRRRRSPSQAAPSPHGGGDGPWLTPPPPGAAGASLRPCGPLSSSSARKKTPLSPGSRTHTLGGSSSGKSVRFPRRVAVVLGCAEALDRSPHELPCTCDAFVTCDGAYILGVHYQCTACSASEADGGDSFDLCGACFDVWSTGREWPHKHGRELFVVKAVNVTGDDGDEAGGDGADGAAQPVQQQAAGLGVSDLLEGSRGLGPRLRLSEDCAAS